MTPFASQTQYIIVAWIHVLLKANQKICKNSNILSKSKSIS
jgi:hypothetical protein